MKVKELIEELSTLNPESDIILSSDPEGNSYMPLWCCNEMFYLSNSRGGVEDIGFDKLTDELIEEGYEEEDVIGGGKPCVILYPG